MMKILICLLVFLPLSIVVAADYDVADYDPDYLPYNFEEVLVFKNCEGLVQQFDDEYTTLTNEYVFQLDNPGGMFGGAHEDTLNGIIKTLENNKFSYQIKFNDCIEEETDKEEDERLKQEAKEREKRKQQQITDALADCDLDFLNNISDSDRMAHYSRIKECEDLQLTAENEISSEPVSVPVSQPVIPVSIPTPYVPPVKTYVPKSIVEVMSESKPEVLDETIGVSTTSNATTTKEIIQLTEEELENIVQERLKQQEEIEPEPAPEKPSFFKRAFNFLFGWFYM